jgi:UDP-N-acetylmuramyl tripeptide synthase
LFAAFAEPAARAGAGSSNVRRGIREAIARRGGDVVLVAGKGHEDYQETGAGRAQALLSDAEAPRPRSSPERERANT